MGHVGLKFKIKLEIKFRPPDIFHRFTTVKTVDERQNVLYSSYSSHVLLSIHLEEGIVKVGTALNILTKDGHSECRMSGPSQRKVSNATATGDEFYGKMAKTYTKMKDAECREKATDFYVNIQVVGPPDDCLQQIAELQRLTGLDHLVAEFSFGGMPREESKINMRLFADRVLPVLQRDAAFANHVPVAPADAPADNGQQAEDGFAPA